jgi:pSer/pThr/pTyr-binding forkhead associated (FHA) protein
LTTNRRYFRVQITTTQGKRETFVQKPSFIIGRGKESDIVLPFSSISRSHLEIKIKNFKVFIHDHNSSNGTRVLGAKIPGLCDIEYQPGQELELGDEQIFLKVFPLSEDQDQHEREKEASDQARSVVIKAREQADELVLMAEQKAHRFNMDLEQIQSKIFQAEAKLDKLLANFEREESRIQVAKAKFEIEMNELEQTKSESLLEIDKLNQQLNEQQGKLQECEADRIQSIKAKEENYQELNQIQEKFQNLSQNIVNSQSELESLKKLKTSVQNEIEEIMSNKFQIKKDIIELENIAKNLKESNQQSIAINEKDILAPYQVEIEQLSNDIASKKTNLYHLQQDLIKVNDDVLLAKKEFEEISQLKQNDSHVDQSISHDHQKLNSVHLELSAGVQKLHQEKDQLEDHLIFLTDQRSEMEKAILLVRDELKIELDKATDLFEKTSPSMQVEKVLPKSFYLSTEDKTQPVDISKLKKSEKQPTLDELEEKRKQQLEKIKMIAEIKKRFNY